MNTLKVGFSRVDITPAMGSPVRGYFVERHAKGVLDPLYLRAIALSCEEKTVVLMSMDICGIPNPLNRKLRQTVAEAVKIPVEAVFLGAIHTHTGPNLLDESDDPYINLFRTEVYHKVVDAAVLAMNDLAPAKMGYAVGNAPHIAFSRRYRMTDGSVRTNPGVNNPEIVEAIGQIDERVNVLRFHRDCKDDVVLVNFGCHPDTVGGELISADWPGFLCSTLEAAIGDCKCMFFNGAQGDVNHVNVHPVGGDLNDTIRDFDDVNRGYGHARHMGRVVAGAVLQVYDKVCYTDVDELSYMEKMLKIPANRPTPEEIPLAKQIVAAEEAGTTDQLPYKGMMLTTMLANSHRVLRLADGPDFFEMPFGVMSVGNVALAAIPGEPFTGIGVNVKKAPGWDLVLPCCLTNGQEGYFPMQEAYDEGGYETSTSPFKPGVAEYIIDEVTDMLKGLKEK